MARGTGLLNNTLYVGRLSWDRCSYVKDPRTGRRVARVNDRARWEEVEVPQLRIVDQDLWGAVKARQGALSFTIKSDGTGNALNRAHRGVFLLSGLLRCGCCGGGYTIIGRDRYGCATRRGRGTCGNGTTITRQAVERRVIDGLRERMLTPALAAEFVRAYRAELTDLERSAGARRAGRRRRGWRRWSAAWTACCARSRTAPGAQVCRRARTSWNGPRRT